MPKDKDFCPPNKIKAALAANATQRGVFGGIPDSLTDAEKTHYARVQGRLEGDSYQKDKAGVWEFLSGNPHKVAASFAPPSELSLKLWQAFEKARQAGGNEAAKQFGREQLEDLTDFSEGFAKTYNLKPDQLGAARAWLTWLRDGGIHARVEDDAFGFLIKPAQNLGKAQANIAPAWAFSNMGSDMTRQYAYYLTRKDGLAASLRATANAVNASGGNIFKRIPEVEAAGFYGSEFQKEYAKAHPLNLFAHSITAQKNLVYYLAKETKTPLHQAREVLFDHDPYDMAQVYQPLIGRNLVFGLSRYSISESRYYFKRGSQALAGIAKGQINDAAKELLVHAALKSATTGLRSTVPAFAWFMMSSDDKLAFTELEQQLSLTGVFNNVIPGVDVAEYNQPLSGLTAGIRLKQLVDHPGAVATDIKKAVKDWNDSKYDAATLRILASGMAINNLTNWSESIPLLDTANSAFITKFTRNLAKELEANEFTDESFNNALGKAAFGQSYNKNTDSDSSVGRRSAY